MRPVRVVDDRRRTLHFATPPRRIVSLVPSDTLSVAALGCAFRPSSVAPTTASSPADVVAKVPAHRGGTKNPRLDDVCAFEPDLVLANQEENTRGDLEELARRGVRVYVAFPRRVADGLAHLAKLARVFGVGRAMRRRAISWARGYHALKDADAARATLQPLRAFCPIWMEPLMTIHGDTFISDMLDLCGAQNVFADRERRYPLAADLGRARPIPREKVGDRDVRYPRVTVEEVVERAPELVLLPDEPHPVHARRTRTCFARWTSPRRRRASWCRPDRRQGPVLRTARGRSRIGLGGEGGGGRFRPGLTRPHRAVAMISVSRGGRSSSIRTTYDCAAGVRRRTRGTRGGREARDDRLRRGGAGSLPKRRPRGFAARSLRGIPLSGTPTRRDEPIVPRFLSQVPRPSSRLRSRRPIGRQEREERKWSEPPALAALRFAGEALETESPGGEWPPARRSCPSPPPHAPDGR